jgi:diguanylate cyclase (GGDEF)-like protein/PAS domain S-box-containing protein
LLIEHSVTIRHIEKNHLIKAGFDVEIDRDYLSALERFKVGSDEADRFDAVVLGWSGDSTPGADELYALLENPANTSKPLLTFVHEMENPIVSRSAQRPNSALLHWKNYHKTTTTLTQLLVTIKKYQHKQRNSKPIIQPIRVLIVDDSATVRVKYRRLLNANGYATEAASSVGEGLKKARESQFDIAIIDYFMPDGTGAMLCQKLRESEATSSITTAIITGTYRDQAIKESLEAGAVECMFKNESDDLFLTRIDAMSRHIRAQKSTEKERERLDGILRSVGEGVYGVDSEGFISFINPACRKILGYEPEDRLIGKSAMALFHYADAEGSALLEKESLLYQTYLEGIPVKGQETVFWHKSGQQIPVEYTIYPLTIDAKCEGSVIAFRDITERKTLEKELRWQANHDALTSLINRRHFEEHLTQEVNRLQRSNETSALLYIDLDRFKYINDTAGHAAGDQLLIEIAHQIECRLRKSDLLARLGGDEFAIILRNINKDSIYKMADSYREMLDHHMFVYNSKQYKVNGSIGIALIDSQSESAGEILANADIACHIAKGEGRNRSHLFFPENDRKKAMDLDLGWSSRLHNALKNNHLILHLQPIIPVAAIPPGLRPDSKGPIYHDLTPFIPEEQQINEVLLRMDDPVWGIVFPGAFLPTAERFNMMDKIDYWVIDAALRKLSLLQQQGYRGMFTINLSGQTIANQSLIDDIESLVVESDVDASKVIFEVTETSAVSNLISANELICRLSGLGCRFALDDFGSGFSSFAHLKNIPVDFIKIDGLFVRGVATDPSDRAIVNSINDIAHSLGKKTIAEYVENVDILNFLLESNVDYVQGHFLSEPMDISAISPQKKTTTQPHTFQ